MNQILPILLVAVLLARDALSRPLVASPTWVTMLIAWVGPLAVVLGAGLALSACDRRLARGAAARGLRGADRAMALARLMLLLLHAIAVIGFGWLDAVRAAIGDLVLLDEVLALLPTVGGLAALSALQYPIERRVREALLLRQLDLGQTIYRIPHRRRYVWMQLRTNVLFLLVPVLVILGGTETVRFVLASAEVAPPWVTELSSLAIGLVVFACAPLIARIVLAVERLPDGPVREDLLAMCRDHGVRARELLLWRTDGSMINAAVMGILGPVRYVLLTDALVESLPRLQLQAVMAHEIGHVRRHHMPWLAVALLALILAASTVASFALVLVPVDLSEAELHWVDLGATGAAMVATLLGFGWISRRFERQADTFAVAHLSAHPPAPFGAVGTPATGTPATEEAGAPSRTAPARAVDVSPVAVAAMQGALSSIARLNCVDPQRRSWRHGSIAWRQSYLQSLAGRPVDRLAIDRVVTRIKLAALLTLVVGVLAVTAWELHAANVAAEAEAAGDRMEIVS